MRIGYNTSTKFCAKFVNHALIEKKNDKGKYDDVVSSFVEFDPDNESDSDTLREVQYYWQDKGLFSDNICFDAFAISKDVLDRDKYKIFILTTQNENYENLDDKKIIGLVEFLNNEEDRNSINYIQINPDNIYVLNKPMYNHIGKAMIDSLKYNYSDKPIVLNSTKSAKKFYEKNDFKRINNIPIQYEWRPDNPDNNSNSLVLFG